MEQDELRIFNALRDEFNKRSSADKDFHQSVADWNRILQFTITDSNNTYNIQFQNGQISPILTGSVARPNITVKSSLKNILAILCGQLDPVGAVMTRKITVLGSPSDLSFLKKFILKESPKIREIAKTVNL